jgi:hypothetical protein
MTWSWAGVQAGVQQDAQPHGQAHDQHLVSETDSGRGDNEGGSHTGTDESAYEQKDDD